MKNKTISLKIIFIRKMAFSAIIQMMVLAVFLFFSQEYINRYQDKKLSNILIINDSFSLDEITKYVILSNQNALELALLNIMQERKLDNIKFIAPEKINDLNSKCLNISNQICYNENNFFSGITSVKNNNKVLGYVIASKKYNSYYSLPMSHGLIFIIATVLIIYIFNLFFLLLPMRRIIDKDTRRLVDFIQKLPDNSIDNLYLIKVEEYKNIGLKFFNEHQKILILQNDKLYYETKKEISEQVAHDIRSPIAAINAIVSILNDIPEKQRNLIKNSSKRINDIANNLLLNSKKYELDINGHQRASPELISRLLVNLINEKKYEYHNLDINIILDVSQNAYNCFATINDIQFNRILSNLINNSIEALNKSGTIKIALKVDNEFIYITVEDNGCGIPADIMPKIMARGFSFNKSDGTGFGLFYANNYIRQLNGLMNVFSKENVGTIITIKLIRASPPVVM